MIFGKSKKQYDNLEKEVDLLKKQMLEMFEVVKDISSSTKIYLDTALQVDNSLKEQIQKENNYLQNISNLNRFYLNVSLKINNKNQYLDILEKINKFYTLNNLNQYGISNKKIDNRICGIKGELEILNALNLNENKNIEFFYDFNIQNKTENIQFDFLVVSKKSIYIMEIKNLNAKELSICKDNNKYYIKSYYDTKNYDTRFDNIIKRYNLINNILNKFKDKYKYDSINVFNIIVFLKNNLITKDETDKNILDIPKDYNISIPLHKEQKLQIILGIENLKSYFERFISKDYKQDFSKQNDTILNDFTSFFKSDISFRGSTDKNYIIEIITEFFDEVYKCIKNKEVLLKFNKNN